LDKPHWWPEASSSTNAHPGFRRQRRAYYYGSAVIRLALAVLILLMAPSVLCARRLPIKSYTTAEGLARDHIRCIVQDSHGFLWLCTTEGLSRFDGYEFSNYRLEHGLPSNVVNDFLEVGDGVYWLATEGGLCRFDARGSGNGRFQCLAQSGGNGVPSPWVLQSDGDGGVWCGTRTGRDGLYHLGRNEPQFRHVDLPMSVPSVTALKRDRRGFLWVGSPEGLYRLDPGGSSRVFTRADGLPNDFVMALMEDRDGKLWVGTREGLASIEPESLHDTRPAKPLAVRSFGVRDGIPGARIESLLQTSDGAIWAGTVGGLAERAPDQVRNQREFQNYTQAEGLTARTVGALAEDRDGNLWVGTFGSGAMKVARNGFSTYGDEDGVSFVSSLFEGRNHALCAILRPDRDLRIACFDGQHFRSVRPAWPKELNYFGWGQGQIAVQDPQSEWWIATGHGLYRFARTERVEELAGAKPVAVYTTRDGLPGDNIFRVFADSHGSVWIGTIGPHGEDGLARWDRSTSSIHVISEADGLHLPAPTAFAEDRSGNVWIGLYHGGLARYRNGRFELFGPKDGLDGLLNSLRIDSTGRLWIATSLGLLQVEEPGKEYVKFIRYRTTNGLASDDVSAVAEDRWGRFYAATGRGIDRFQPEHGGLGPVKHYTRADGLVPGELDLAFPDRDGNLWFSTSLGVSRFVPTPDRAIAPPPVLITGLSVGGISQPVPDFGAASISSLRVKQTPLHISFVGLGYSPGETLRYEYRLRNEELSWSPLTDQRSVTYAKLTPGQYQFEVRAVAGDGAASPVAASVSFTVLPPVWRTWWFLTFCAGMAAMAIYGFHRHRLTQLLAVANVRTRIATDLHDDIGASLSQIAILSEVAQREVCESGGQGHEPLTAIAGISRQLVDSMSDIVWAIAPEHDRLTDLIYRMRRLAGDLLAAQGIGFQFHSAIADDDLKVGANVRRELYLIFKEALHNIARHSSATQVNVGLERDGNFLFLRLHDNGCGFDPDGDYEGRGLRNMRARAEALGGKVRFESQTQQGTYVWITIRLDSARSLSTLRGK